MGSEMCIRDSLYLCCMQPFAPFPRTIHEHEVLDDESSKQGLYCQHLQHTLQSLIERCPLGSNAGLQLIEDYLMQVKQQSQHIFFVSDAHFHAFAFVCGRHHSFSSCPSTEAFAIAAVSKRFQLQMQAHFPMLRSQRSVASLRFPNLATLEVSLGKPVWYLPVPLWHQWKLDAWAKLCPAWQDIPQETCPWQFSGPIYHRDASEAVSLWHSQNSTVLYRYVRFQFSSWAFDAESETWAQMSFNTIKL